MKREIVSGLLSLGVGMLGGCGRVDTAAEDVSSVDEEVAVAVLWNCKATCSVGGVAKKITYVDCNTNSGSAKNDAVGECKAAYGGGATVASSSCKTFRPLTQCQLPNGGGWGDPHMWSYDGIRYDIQSIGEFVLATDNETFAIQARTEQWGGSRASVQTAVAIQMEGVKVGIYLKEQPTLRINGQPAVIPCADQPIPNGQLCSGRINFENGGWLTYDANARKVAVYLADQLSHFDTFLNGSYMNTQFFAGPAIKGKVTGLLGTANADVKDDFMTRDGKVLAQPLNYTQMYEVFGNSWRISDVESLFDYKDGYGTSDFTNMAFPGGKPMTVKDLPQAVYDAAKAACQAKGIPANLMDDCILDAAVMGHETAGEVMKFGAF